MQRASMTPEVAATKQPPLTKIKTDTSTSEKSLVFNKQFATSAKIHSTSTIDIYLGRNLETKEQIAIKTEKVSNREQILAGEARVLNSLRSKENEEVVGIPKLFWFGNEEHDNTHLSIMVMQLTGPSLGLLCGTQNQRFSLKTTLMLADQMIKRLEYIHLKGYVHRDVKPHNFAIGLLTKSNIVYLVNFGHAKQFKNSKTGLHKGYVENREMIGSVTFSSINCHMGIEPSRRDDLESLAYTLIYFMKGSLPWQGTQASSNSEKVSKIMDKKISIPPELLCKGLPDAFSCFVSYCRGLKYDEKPDYKYIRDLFRRAMVEKDLVYDNNFDWVKQDTAANNAIYEYGDLSISFSRRSSETSNMAFSQPFERSRILLATRIETDAFSQQEEESSSSLPQDMSISLGHRTDKFFPSKSSIMPSTVIAKEKPQRYFTEGDEESKKNEDEKFRNYLELRNKTRTLENKSFDEDKRFKQSHTESTTNKTISLRVPEMNENKDRSTVCNVFLTEEEDEGEEFESDSDNKELDIETVYHQVKLTDDPKHEAFRYGIALEKLESEEEIETKPKVDRSKTLNRTKTGGKTMGRTQTLYSKDSDDKEFEIMSHSSLDLRESESDPKLQKQESGDEKGCTMF